MLGPGVPDFPKQLHLPSGRTVHASCVAPTCESAPPAEPSLFQDALALFDRRVSITNERGEAISIGELRLDDFHTLRAIANRVGILIEAPITLRCNNCEHWFDASPSSAIELGPFIDGELCDPELDPAFPFGEPQPIPEVTLDAKCMNTVTFIERTVDDARPLWHALAGSDWHFDAKLVRAMGIQSLGDEHRADAIASALSDASDEVIDAILDSFDQAYYPLRLRPPVTCPECGAIEYVDAPVEREFPASDYPRAGHVGEPFLDADAFELRVRLIADDIYRRRNISKAVHLNVDLGVPAIDEGGIPLLGSYLPGGADPATGVIHAPEVTLYYRTFRSMWEDEGPYDVDAELRETIDHELEHHLHYIEGHDPLDDDERAAIGKDYQRLVGRRETLRRARAMVVADFAEFLRRTWPLWLLAALLTAVASLAER